MSNRPTLVEDAEIGADQPPALLVRPQDAAPAGQPAVLWLHWLGHNRGNRTQFLPEAVRLAQHGVVSLLPQGVFPWLVDPQGDESDRVAVADQARRCRQAYEWLHGHPLVERGRIAVVAHDYGGMYALNLPDVPVRAMVVAAPDATWDHWFRKYWLDDADLGRGYADQFCDLDPLAGAGRHQDHLLLQWAANDEYVEPIVRDRYAAAAPRAAVSVHARYDHQLGDRAIEERYRFLVEALDLAEVATPA